MKGYYIVEVRDKDGKLLSRERRKSRSYVRQWIDIHQIKASQVDGSVKDIAGATISVSASRVAFEMNGGAGSDEIGIVIGTSTAAVTISDYVLGAKIDEGTGTGQMSYLANSFGAVTISGSEAYYTVTRIINNSSGASITVHEIGIDILARDTTGVTKKFLAIRDVLATSQVVPNGGAITVVYTLKVVV